MKPLELNGHSFPLPEHSNRKIIIISGSNAIRHQIFALQIQKAFPKDVIAWYEYEYNFEKRNNRNDQKKYKYQSLFNRLLKFVKIKNKFYHLYKKYNDLFLLKKYNKLNKQYDQNPIFLKQLKRLQKYQVIKKNIINSKLVNTDKFCLELKKHNAYFLISSGGPLLNKNSLTTIKGIAINLHTGHVPSYRGNGTLSWALYNRRLDRLSSTIHLMSTAADSGDIIRRSNVQLHSTDTPHSIFYKTFFLGVYLMIESINEAMLNNELLVFKQPKHIGNTYLNKDLTSDVLLSIIYDFNRGWLNDALNKFKY